MPWQQQLEDDGFAIVENILQPCEVDRLIAQLDAILPTPGADRRAGYGLRNVLKQSAAVRALVTHEKIASLIADALGADAFAVRAILFDKIEGANWHVGWHQDQAIAIRELADVAGFGPTSIKHDVPHTRASAKVLEQMLAVRIHLDDCGPDNGPLRCVPASHTLGRLDPEHSLAVKEKLGERICTVGRGGVLLMRPLCLHASSPAVSPRHRRVIHIEFAGCELPDTLDWHERHPIGASPGS